MVLGVTVRVLPVWPPRLKLNAPVDVHTLPRDHVIDACRWLAVRCGAVLQVDPTLTRADRLVGQVLGEVGALPEVFIELEINFFLLRRLLGVRSKEGEKQSKVSGQGVCEVGGARRGQGAGAARWSAWLGWVCAGPWGREPWVELSMVGLPLAQRVVVTSG